MIKKTIINKINGICCLLSVVCCPLSAQNPIIRDQYTADPTARVFNNKVYLYPSHDIFPPQGQRQDWFCMADYHVFSSENLIDWTDHGVIVTQADVPWGNPEGYSMWAPECVCKNGKYYFYFPNAPKSGRGFAIGVATASRPEGPFTLEQEPILGVSGIDPCVLVDNDGSAYIYWSGMGIRGAKLKDNMLELDGELQTVTFAPPANASQGEGMRPGRMQMRVGGQVMEGLPDGFKEGPYAFRRGDWYYLTFPWVRGETGDGKNPTETLAYAMSKSPLGPWDFKGIIMAEHANHCWTNHHSIIEYKGQWYLFYHHNDYSPNDDKRRSACAEKLSFNADGTIQEVRPTMRGVGITPATNRIEVDRYSAASSDAVIAYNDTLNTFQGWNVLLPSKGSWARYDDVDFSSLTQGAYVIVNAMAHANTQFYVREKDAKGKVLAKFTMTVITQMGQFRRDQSGQWLTLTAPLESIPTGVGNICVTCEEEGVSINWVQFKNRDDYFTFLTSNPSSLTSQPDANGFIRRWMLLEPINYDVRSNIILTESYLNENLTKPFFKGLFDDKRLPRNGEKVTATGTVSTGPADPRMATGPATTAQTKQTLRWHAIESNTYNVKVFRFAELTGCQPYNSLFWGVTVIDSPADMDNVRLAVGSNGASMWWLNGERVLTLDGDRRMVEDDCVSQRIMLKKGRNVLRFALVNGPGLSDFCVRFIDEQGKPVTNLKVTSDK